MEEGEDLDKSRFSDAEELAKTDLNSPLSLEDERRSLHMAAARGDVQEVEAGAADTKEKLAKTDVNSPLSLEDERRSLHVAAARGDVQEVEAGAADTKEKLAKTDVNSPLSLEDERRSLHVAAARGDVQEAEAGAADTKEKLAKTDVNSPLSLEDERRSLHVAAARGDVQEVEAGAADTKEKLAKTDVNSPLSLEDERRSLHVAAARGDVQEVEAGAADTKEELAKTDVNSPLSLEDGRRPMHVAAARGDVSEVEALLGLGAYADMPDYTGNTAIHYAAQEGHIEVVKVLADNIPTLDITNDEDFTPLAIAYKYNQRAVLKLLLAKGANVYDIKVDLCVLMLTALEDNDKDLLDLLIKLEVHIDLEEATKTENFDLVKYVLDKSLSRSDSFHLTKSDGTVNTSFNIAIATGKSNLVEIFLNCDVDLENKYNNPLWTALINEQFEIAEKLTDRGAKVDQFAVHEAVKLEKLSVLDFVLNKNNDVNVKNGLGKTPLFVAVEMNNVEIVRYLIQKQADLNLTSEQGESPLYISVKNKEIEMTQLLLENKALVDSNYFDMSPIYIAVTKNQVDVVELLIDKRADLNIEDTFGETLLSIAIRRGYVPIANMLLDAAARVDYKDASGCSLLHLAIWKGEVDLCKRLLDKGVSVDATTDEGNTPLMSAIAQLEQHDKSSLTELIRILIDHGANVKVTNNKGLQAINLALKLFNGHQLVELLVENGALENINENAHLFDLLSDAFKRKHDVLIKHFLGSDLDLRTMKSEEGATGLHMAAIWGNTDGIKAFLSKGVHVNVQDKNGDTPLHMSCSTQNVDAIKMLLENGADMSLLNKRGFSPVHRIVFSYTSWDFPRDLCKLFIEQEGFVDHADPNGRTVCHALARENSVGLMQLYLDRGLGNNVNIQDVAGNTPFHIAVEHGHVEMSTLISKYVLDPNLKNKYGFTPLELALRIHRPEQNVLVKLILEMGANLNLPNDFGSTAIHVSVGQKDLPMTKLLLESGANLKIRNKEGNTVLHISVFNRDVGLSEILLKHSGSIDGSAEEDSTDSHQSLTEDKAVNNTVPKFDLVNTGNKDGKTPLHYAAGADFEEIVQLLVDNSANINAKDQDGFTPLMTATKKGHRRMVEKLFHLGAVIDFSNSTLICTLLNDAIRHKCVFLIDYLLKNEIDINKQDGKGNTAFHVAASQYWGHDLVLSLLNKGANVNIINEEGESAFHVAARQFFGNLLEQFLQRGADVNIANMKKETVLHVIVGNPSCVEIGLLLMKQGANVDALNYKNQTPLLCSLLTTNCRNLRVDFIKLLLENGANPNIADNEGKTCLKVALNYLWYRCMRDCEGKCVSMEIVSMLFDNGASVETDQIEYFKEFVERAIQLNKIDLVKMFTKDESDLHGKHIILHVALRMKCYELVDALMSKGVECNTTCSKYRVESPISVALMDGDAKLLGIICKRLKHVTLSDFNRNPVWRYASTSYAQMLSKIGPPDCFVTKYCFTELFNNNQLGKALMLLDRGISLDVRDDQGWSPLQLAVRRGCLAIVDILLRKEVDVDAANDKGETALHTACRSNNVAIARVLIEHKASTSAQDIGGRTPLHVVDYYNDTTGLWEIVNLLIDNGAPVDMADVQYNTPLHICKSFKVAKLLLQKGASVDARDYFGRTPLHLASSVEVARVLVEHGAPINAKDLNGYTPLHSGVSTSLEITKLLLDNNAIVDEKGVDGATPLCEAVQCGCEESKSVIVQILIEKGADCDIVPEFGYCTGMLDFAINGKFKQLHILLDNGANIDNCRSLQSMLKQRQSLFYHELDYRTQYIVLIKHIYKLKLAGLPTQYDWETVEKWIPACGDEISVTFFISCLKELDEIRSTEVYEGFTLGDIINNYKKPYFLLDEGLVESFDSFLQSPSLPDLFPIYGFILRNVYKELKSRRFYLLHSASSSMEKDTRTPPCKRLNEDVKEKLFEYLSDEDLQNLIKSGNSG